MNASDPLMNNQRWLSTSYFVFFFTWGIFIPYWTGWLTNVQGLTVTAASIIMGVGMIVRSFSTFLIFPYLTLKMPLQSVVKWATILSLFITLFYIPQLNFTTLLIVTAIFSFVYPMILPGIESSASVLMQHERIHYGRSRSFGSIGYTIALLVIGAATTLWAEQAILYFMIIGLVLASLFFLSPSPAVLNKLHHVPTETPTKTIRFRDVMKTPGFPIILLLAVLLQGAHASYYNYGYIFLDDLQVNGVYIGIILNVAVLFEILFFTQADRLLASTKISTMFLIAGIGSTIRWIAIFLFPTTIVFIASQMLHAISFGIAHFAFIQFISKNLPHAHIASAQGMYAAFAMSLSTAFLTFPAGYLYDISPQSAFLGMTVCTIPAIFIVLITRRRFSY